MACCCDFRRKLVCNRSERQQQLPFSSTEKMTRFESLNHAPAETRKVLRERYERNLRAQRQQRAPTQAERVFDDELVLKLFQNLIVLSNNAPGLARQFYEEASEHAQGAPTLDELIAEGWIASGWKCLSVPFDVARAATNENNSRLAPFVAWLNVRHDSKYRIRNLSDADEQLVALAESVVNETVPPSHVVCRTPTWVAARLWDRDNRHHTGDADFLFDWLCVWEMLGYPKVVPSEAWDEDARNHFINAALAVLENDANPLSWSDYRHRGILQLAHARQVESDRLASSLPEVPATLVSRAVWLVDNQMERLRYENGSWNHAAGLVSLLLAEVEYADNAPAPHPIAKRVLDLALKHPEVLSTVLFGVEQRPSLIADMTLKPETAALACLLVSRWRVMSGAWDRALTLLDSEAARTEAFTDALSVMCHHAKSGCLAPPEVAALLHELHANALQDDDVEPTGNTMLAALRSELVGLQRAFLISMHDALVNGDFETDVGSPAFSAALDVVDAGQLISDVNCLPLVGAYIRSIREPNYRLSTARISPDGAAVLYDMCQQLDQTTQREFLFPVDIGARLSSITSDENSYTVKEDLARALRAHMRVLARAVIGQRDKIPQELIDALADTVYSGAFANCEKGRVAAFAVRFERPPTGRACESGLAEDFGRALSCLSDADGARLLKEILSIDEPAFLAQLCRLAPPTMQSVIRERIRDLAPRRAGNAWYLTDIQFRIDELLAAGEYSAAKAYMDSMPEPRSALANQFELVRLRHRLQFALAVKDWEALENTTVPPETSRVNIDAARDTLLFYRAVAQFTKERGDIESAEGVFAQLHQRHRGVPEYGFNLFAAKLARLVGDEPFARLQGENLLRARTLLGEALQMEATYDLAKSNADSYLTNKALLLLAIGQTRQAEEVLRGIFLTRMTDRVAAYLAVAFARLGKSPDALATLDAAEKSLGASDVMDAARAHVLDDSAVAGPPIRVAETDSLDVAGLERAVYRIDCRDDSALKYSEGSAFLMNGLGIVTCDHVVQRPMEEHDVEPQGYFGVHGGRIFLQDRLMQDVCELEIVWSSPIPDVALLRPKAQLPEKCLHLDVSELTIETGVPVQLCGFPNHSAGKTLSRYGTSIANSYNEKTYLHYEIAQNIRKGNSGGPVLDEANRLVGIAKEGSTQAGGNDAVVSIMEVQRLNKMFTVTPWKPS